MDTLEGQRICLRPLQLSDADVLVNAARDGELWNLTVTVVPSPTIDSHLKKALDGRDAGTVQPYVIVLKDTGEVNPQARRTARRHRAPRTDHAGWTQAQFSTVQHH